MIFPRQRPITTVAVLVALCAPAMAAAQLIGIRSVPIATGDQFSIHPSRNAALGGLSIAIADPLADPFSNPALGMRMSEPRLWGAPMFSNVSGGDGSIRTLPVGATFGSDSWFGGISLALQQIVGAQSDQFFVRPLGGSFTGARELSDRAANTYVTGLFGYRIAGTRLAIGASASYADLNAVDGVDQLYALSQDIEQFGHVADFRVGISGLTEAGGEFEALLLHNRFDMTHDVTYFDWILIDPIPCEFGQPCPQPALRTENNRDRTNTWGAHLGYRRPVGERGWTVGAILTANRQTHPGIPNYEIANIPRDPGDSWAWNIGMGAARTIGPAVFGIDVIWEPITSNTWAESDTEFVTADGRLIKAGDKTVDNDFDFSNAIVRLGAGRETDQWGLQLGLEVHSYGYTLNQHDLVVNTRRRQDESWMEWTPTWGAALKFPELDIRYTGRIRTGTGTPGVAWTGFARAELDLASNFIIAPSGPLTLQDATVMTHQLSVSLPIR